MKQLLYFFLMMGFFSCADASRKNYEESISMDKIAVNASIVSSNNKYEDIAIQKFQNYNDLLKLKEENPEMKEDVLAQLYKLSKENNIIDLYDTHVFIDSVYQKGGVEKISNNIQKIKLLYSLTSKGNKVKDSVFAYITSTNIEIDGRQMVANKVAFSKK